MRDRNRFKALGLYVKSQNYKKHYSLEEWGMIEDTYYFTENMDPSKTPCIYVMKRKKKVKGKYYSRTSIVHSNYTTIWSKWH